MNQENRPFYTKAMGRVFFDLRREATRAFEEATLLDIEGCLRAVRRARESAEMLDKHLVELINKRRVDALEAQYGTLEENIELTKNQNQPTPSTAGSSSPVGNARAKRKTKPIQLPTNGQSPRKKPKRK